MKTIRKFSNGLVASRRYRTYHVGDGVEPRDPLHIGVADTGSTEDGWRVDGHSSNPDPFLHDLQPDDKLNATTGMELARADTEKHGEVGLAGRSFALEFCDVADILEFGFGLANILSSLATETAKDVASLFLTANLDEPTGGLGENEHDSEKEEQGDNLERNGESPREGAVASGVERAAILEPVSHNDTEDVETEFDGNELSTGRMLGGLRCPDGNDGVQDTGSPAVDQTGEDHPDVVLSGSLQAGTKNSPTSTQGDCLDTAILVTEPATNQAANQGTDVVDRNLISALSGTRMFHLASRNLQCLPGVRCCR